jgi:hypothetical protein
MTQDFHFSTSPIDKLQQAHLGVYGREGCGRRQETEIEKVEQALPGTKGKGREGGGGGPNNVYTCEQM